MRMSRSEHKIQKAENNILKNKTERESARTQDRERQRERQKETERRVDMKSLNFFSSIGESISIPVDDTPDKCADRLGFLGAGASSHCAQSVP